VRLDRAVAERGLARSRAHAQELIAAGLVLVEGVIATKASAHVADAELISLADSRGIHYVSRAAFKLAGALEALAPRGLRVAGRACLDAGASTGGFTQVLLEWEAERVLAVDVGHSQFDAGLAEDPRVTVVEGVNVKDLGADSPGAGVELVVADLSFISLTHVIGPLVAFAAPTADFLLMVKPQFEVGKHALGAGGVVREPSSRADAVTGVVAHMRHAGLGIHSVERSGLPGPAGNVEFFVWGSGSWQARGAGAPPVLDDEQLARHIADAGGRT
jgi:23S rRNA (cytidine1920-2'-O)/16S rRNA (cytidine1409-2'-O)-methyltransferase